MKLNYLRQWRASSYHDEALNNLSFEVLDKDDHFIGFISAVKLSKALADNHTDPIITIREHPFPAYHFRRFEVITALGRYL